MKSPILLISILGGIGYFLTKDKKSSTTDYFANDHNRIHRKLITKFPGYEIKGTNIIATDKILAEQYARDKGKECSFNHNYEISLNNKSKGSHFIEAIYDLLGLDYAEHWYKESNGKCLRVLSRKKLTQNDIQKLIKLYDNNSEILNSLYLTRLSSMLPNLDHVNNQVSEIVNEYLDNLEYYGVNMSKVFTKEDVKKL